MVSPILHFSWGYQEGSAFGLVDRLAIVSAAHHNADWDVILWSPRTPSGEHWEAVLAHVPRIKVMPAPQFTHFNKREIAKYAHKSDLLRHTVLYALGGAYLDLDTVTLRPFPKEWLNFPYVVGVEYRQDGSVIGLCNAAFLCAPFSPFGWKILSEFQYWDPSVHGYAEFSVFRPVMWSKEMEPGQVHVVPWQLLGPMHWDRDAYWGRRDTLQGVVVAHLWGTLCREKLNSLTVEELRNGEFAYADAVKQFL
jgi:hypothetical protein